MKKIRTFFIRTILGIMAGLFLSAGITATPVQAAGISYQKAVRMYNNKLSYWGRRGTRLNINYDLRSRSGWKYNDCGKNVSMKTVHCDNNLRYIFRDVNGDNIPEAFFYSERARVMLVWTIYRGQVQPVATMRTSYFGPQKLLYNKREKTFIVKSVETERMVVPIHFEGRNSNFFYNLANLCKFLGVKFNVAMLFLVDEMYKNRHKTFKVTFGKPIPWQTFNKSRNAAEWADYVRELVYKL